MKKNTQYIGVDDKFIPEDEKYVDDSLLGDKEETRKTIKKTAKVVGIGYLVSISISLIIFAIIFVTAFKFIGNTFNQINNQSGSMFNQTSNFNSELEQAKMEGEKKSFNWDFEMYSGTKRKNSIMSVLDNVVKNNKTNQSRIITVIYNENNTTDPNSIIELKKLFEESKDYEVILDYDVNGYVNKVTIKDI